MKKVEPMSTYRESIETQIDSAPTSLASYVALVNKCASGRLNLQIANGSAEHARILIAKLFEFAESRVRIITGTLRQKTKSEGVEIYAHQPVIDQACAFISKPNSRLEIIVQSGSLDGGEDNALLNALSQHKARQGEVVVLVPKAGLLGEEVAHFMVADASAYRIETGQDAKPSNRGIVAFANFGDLKLSKSVSNYFEQVTRYIEADDRLAQRVIFNR